MKKMIVLLSGCLAGVSALAQTYGSDPFSYTSGSGLIGNGSWVDGGGGSGVGSGPTINTGNLSYPGLSTSGGTSAQFGGGNENAMFALSGGGTGTWSGSAPLSVYFSYELDLTSAANAGPFELTALDQKSSSPIGSRGAEVVVEGNSAGTGFYIGIMKGGQNGNNVAANDQGIKWIGGDNGSGGIVSGTTTLFAYNTVDLIVGAYNFQGTTKAAQTSGHDDDTANLWVDPAASTFGLTSAPTADVTATNTSATKFDLVNIAGFDLIQSDGSTNAAPVGEMDDLELGTSWAQVTPAGTPEPSSVALGALALGLLVARRLGKSF